LPQNRRGMFWTEQLRQTVCAMRENVAVHANVVLRDRLQGVERRF
jgi:hypothetical protein